MWSPSVSRSIVVEDLTAGLAVAGEGEVADLAGHGGPVVVSETEGVEHVGAGALGGGTMIIRAKFGDVDDSEDLTVFGFAQPGGRGVRVPAGRASAGCASNSCTRVLTAWDWVRSARYWSTTAARQRREAE